MFLLQLFRPNNMFLLQLLRMYNFYLLYSSF